MIILLINIGGNEISLLYNLQYLYSSFPLLEAKQQFTVALEVTSGSELALRLLSNF